MYQNLATRYNKWRVYMPADLVVRFNLCGIRYFHFHNINRMHAQFLSTICFGWTQSGTKKNCGRCYWVISWEEALSMQEW